MAIEEFAPAKVNLALHVTGRRDDGYHLLDSLVVFAGAGDRVSAAPAADLTLTIGGPMAAGVPSGGDNLVLRAACLMGAGQGARLDLEKNLPVASGIGGGSADAAATLRALARLWQVPLPEPEAVLALGADLPVCLAGQPARMSGIGETLAPVPPLPPCWLVLVNPGVALETRTVFAGLERADNLLMEPFPTRWGDAGGLVAWLARQRNDLEAPACRTCPAISEVLSALGGQPGVALARMSGSGATCFGLCGQEAAARAAARVLGAARPDWWVTAAPLLD
ncbi:4-(cytidine 5'-diphospho)-2-C-methyl-D-erythritol kinase [Maritimibacter sp. 55A14]|uniref:4-(cytidine 5'-diphospho)-2-C-methyl-D-erythritol kinase n=1 Tax=Maritimibacter sp. 55A14 TaxID=2174844 RepID=UPI000D619976|nr:4-(cytidine 5'-diphospho)-2-C-methyl-D-erythritol kinase [Maritimibacter sp. 55A14]PWE32463.1 4-(cytidine 5'-diphospho)-2-C-methyl-D-erythritol kinase [Maritimibacter sp. 55A14]